MVSSVMNGLKWVWYMAMNYASLMQHTRCIIMQLILSFIGFKPCNLLCNFVIFLPVAAEALEN